MVQRILCILIAFLAMLPAAGQKEFCLENNAVTQFLADRTYDQNTSYGTSVISSYNSSTYYSGSRHHPMPVGISWTASVGVQEHIVLVSESADYSNALRYTVSSAESSMNVYNLIPGRVYYYKVMGRKADGTEIAEASDVFKTTGQVRMIKVDGVNNVRDLGGWPTSFGTPVKYGRVYRGGNLDGIIATGREAFHDYVGVRAELDLRRTDETVISSSPLGPDVPYQRTSTTEYYDGMANNPTTLISDFKWIVKNLRQGRPTMFHCLIGADRTGTLAFMQEGVLGLSEPNLCRDYELTTLSVVGTRLRTQLADMASYVKTFAGNSLQQKFYNYLLSKGMTRDELDDYIAIMLDNYTLPTRIITEADQYSLQTGDKVSLSPSFRPVDYAPSVTYSSSDESVASVSPSGEVEAHSAGQAIITIRIGFHSEVSVQIAVTVREGQESAVPQQVAVAQGTALSIYNVAGANLISNGSFEYPSSTALWTTVNNEQLAPSCFKTMTDGAACGTNYIQSLQSGAYDTPASIVRSVAVVPGKTYALGYCIRNTDGIAVTHNPDFKVLLKSGSTASGTTDDFSSGGNGGEGDGTGKPGGTVDDFIMGSPQFVGAVGPEAQELDFHPSYNGEWTPQVCVFTVPEGYCWAELQFVNMGNYGGATCLDNFFLAESVPAGSITAVSDYLRQVCNGIKLSNFGTDPLQHPAAGKQAVDSATADALEMLGEGVTAAQAAEAVNRIRLALAAFASAPLNAPDPQQCYLIEADGKVLTLQSDNSAVFLQPAADAVDQGFRFLYTTQPDVYVIEYPLDDGTSLYLAAPSGSAFALTANRAEATSFKVVATDGEGMSQLATADGYTSSFVFSLTPDYGIINSVDAIEGEASLRYYGLDGYQRLAPMPGINIVRYPDGTVRKIKR